MSAPSPAPSDVPDQATTSGSERPAPQRGTRGRITEAGLVVTTWSNWGKHRLYVNTMDDEQVGWLDQDTGTPHLTRPDLAGEFEAALQEATAPASDYSPRRTFTEPVVDLAERRPGEQLEVHIAATIAAGGQLKPAHPDFDGKRGYSSWELGVLGERAVAEELDRLAALDPSWGFLHSIPVGTRKTDIDHLVVGPGGVFSLNAKHHHAGDIWVAGDAFKVNHSSWKHYVANSRAEAARATRLLSAAVELDVAVTGVIVLVGVTNLTVVEQPCDVHVLDESELVDFLLAQPQRLDAEACRRTLTGARLSSTWT